MARVAVMGSGNGSQAMAADLTLKGHEVSLYESEQFASSANAKYVFTNKEIRLEGRAGDGVANIACVTSDIAEAVKGAEVIFADSKGEAEAGRGRTGTGKGGTGGKAHWKCTAGAGKTACAHPLKPSEPRISRAVPAFAGTALFGVLGSL